MDFDLLPEPKLVPIPEELGLALRKLREKLEEKASNYKDALFSDKVSSAKKAKPEQSTDRLCGLAPILTNMECGICEEEFNPIVLPKEREKTFRDLLFEMIDSRGLIDSDVYKKALVDRKTFSKIRTNNDYHPSKGIVLQLCLALELSIKDTLSLLKSADYYLTKNSDENVIMYYIIEKKIFNVVEANNLLYSSCGKTIDKL